LLIASCLAVLIVWHFIPHVLKTKGIMVSITLLKHNTNECVIAVQLVNHETNDLTFSASGLPWCLIGESISMELLRGKRLQTPIKRTPLLLDPRVGLEIIKAGESKAVEVHLEAYYYGLLPELLEQDVLMNWTYQPQAIGGKEYEPIVGSLTIPKWVDPDKR
jgi:hypothetical protein